MMHGTHPEDAFVHILFDFLDLLLEVGLAQLPCQGLCFQLVDQLLVVVLGRALLIIRFTTTKNLLKQLVPLGRSHVDH